MRIHFSLDSHEQNNLIYCRLLQNSVFYNPLAIKSFLTDIKTRWLLGWRVLTAFWVTFNFCHADSILLVHLHHKRDVPSLMTFGGKLLVPRPMQFYKGIPQ